MSFIIIIFASTVPPRNHGQTGTVLLGPVRIDFGLAVPMHQRQGDTGISPRTCGRCGSCSTACCASWAERCSDCMRLGGLADFSGLGGGASDSLRGGAVGALMMGGKYTHRCRSMHVAARDQCKHGRIYLAAGAGSAAASALGAFFLGALPSGEASSATRSGSVTACSDLKADASKTGLLTRSVPLAVSRITDLNCATNSPAAREGRPMAHVQRTVLLEVHEEGVHDAVRGTLGHAETRLRLVLEGAACRERDRLSCAPQTGARRGTPGTSC